MIVGLPARVTGLVRTGEWRKRERGLRERGKRTLSRLPFALLSPSSPLPFFEHAMQAIGLPVLNKLVNDIRDTYLNEDWTVVIDILQGNSYCFLA